MTIRQLPRTPFKSSGYMKNDDSRGPNSFAMKNMSEGSQSRSRDPYDEDVMLGKETYSVDARGRLGCVRSQGGESDESILPHDESRKQSSAPRGMTIVRTTDINVSR